MQWPTRRYFLLYHIALSDGSKLTLAQSTVKKAESDDESSESGSESESESGLDASSDSEEDSEEESDEEENEDEPQPKKRKAEEAAPAPAKKTKTEVSGNSEGSKNLFVGNLSWNVDEEWLTREFEAFGELTRVSIMTDKQTGRSRG